MVCDAVVSCDLEARKELFANLILTGGHSSVDGCADRLLREVAATAPPMFKVKLIAASAGERRVGAWLGGSILGSLGSFNDMWLSRAEYDEQGAAAVERKCP